MYEIYTPKEWLSVFGGCPSIIIDDQGYIYNREEYYKVFGGTPIGYINYQTGKIYGADYAKFSAAPIGEIKIKSDVTEIYGKDYAKFGARPILYIDNDKIYTADEYYRIFGGSPAGYLKGNGENNGFFGERKKKKSYDNSVAKGCLSTDFGGSIAIFLVIVMILLIGNFIESLKDALPTIIGACVVFLILFIIGKVWAAKRKNSSGASKSNTSYTNNNYNNPANRSVNTSNQNATNTAKAYTYVCSQCGKQFVSYSQNPPSMLCSQCRMSVIKAKNGSSATKTTGSYNIYSDNKVNNQKPNNNYSKPQQGSTTKAYNYVCEMCGKTYVSYQANPSKKYCSSCSMKITKAKQNGNVVNNGAAKTTYTKTAAPTKTAMVYAHECPKCGRKFTSTIKDPKIMICDKCK